MSSRHAADPVPAAANPVSAAGDPDATLPSGFQPRQLLRRALQVVLLLGVLILVAALAPGLDQVRDELVSADPWWLALGVGFELLSCLSYVLMFRPVFCDQMSWRAAARIGWAELGMGSIVPASGAAGLALGAWALVQSGMPRERVARRSVAFFVIKSSVNFVAVVVIGAAMAVRLVGPPVSPLLTALPAALALLTIVAVVALPRIGPGIVPAAGSGHLRRAFALVRRSVIDGTREASAIVRSGDVRVIAGAIGYWLWDNAVLWATYHALGVSINPWIVLMGYLIGQLGGLLPIPGGVGGIDVGLIGMLILYGAPAAATAAAVLAYRVILFWLPLVGGGIAFVSLRRHLARERGAMFEAC